MINNRESDALKSLKWVRGWRKSQNHVEAEYSDMKRYKEFSNACAGCRKGKLKCTHPPATFVQKIKELIQKRTLKPYFICVVCGLIGFTCGSHHLMPYIVPILNTYQSPISANWATVCFKTIYFQCSLFIYDEFISFQVLIGFVAVCSTVTTIFLMKLFGKRNIYLVSLGGTVATMFALGMFGTLLNLIDEKFSFHPFDIFSLQPYTDFVIYHQDLDHINPEKSQQIQKI